MNTHYKTLLVLLSLAVSLVGHRSADAQPANVSKSGGIERTLNLFIGEQSVISSANVDRFSLGTAGIVDVRTTEEGDSFVIVALATGTTTLLLLMKDGTQIRYTMSVREVRVAERDNIRLDFYFVELSKEEGSRIGVGWPGTIGGNTSVALQANLETGSLTSATANIATQVLPRLDFAQDRGWARVIRESSVIMANGETGSFESGAELNFRVANSVSTGIQKIEFGSRVEVQPRYDRTTQRLDVRVSAVVSELTNSAADGLPGRSFTKLNTLVNLELGQSIVLAGIHSESRSRRSEGIPWLNRIPVIGYLFGSKTYRKNTVDNLVFIVPTVIQSVDIEERDLVKAAYRFYRAPGNSQRALRQQALPSVVGGK